MDKAAPEGPKAEKPSQITLELRGKMHRSSVREEAGRDQHSGYPRTGGGGGAFEEQQTARHNWLIRGMLRHGHGGPHLPCQGPCIQSWKEC